MAGKKRVKKQTRVNFNELVKIRNRKKSNLANR